MAFIECRGGVRLSYESRGAGSPIVFVHAVTLNQSFWDHQVAALMGSHRVITFDLRGHGKSDRPDGPYSIDTYAEDLGELIRGLDLHDVTLVGWSMGSWISATFAHRNPKAISRLVMVGGSPLLLNQPGWTLGVDLAAFMAMSEMVAQDRAFATQEIYRGTLHKGASQPMLDRIVRAALETPLFVSNPSWQSVLTTDLRPILKDIAVPTLVMHGAQDSIPLEAAKHLAAGFPKAKLVTFEKSGHFPQLEESTAFTQALSKFIAETPAH